MRIRIVQRPTVEFIDGVRLDQFRPGHVYQLGSLMAGVFLAEGWAEPVDDQETRTPGCARNSSKPDQGVLPAVLRRIAVRPRRRTGIPPPRSPPPQVTHPANTLTHDRHPVHAPTTPAIARVHRRRVAHPGIGDGRQHGVLQRSVWCRPPSARLSGRLTPGDDSQSLEWGDRDWWAPLPRRVPRLSGAPTRLRGSGRVRPRADDTDVNRRRGRACRAGQSVERHREPVSGPRRWSRARSRPARRRRARGAGCRAEPRVVAIAVRWRRRHPRTHHPPQRRRVHHCWRHARRLRLSRAGHGCLGADRRQRARRFRPQRPLPCGDRATGAGGERGRCAPRLAAHRRRAAARSAGSVWSGRAVEHRRAVPATDPVRPHADAARVGDDGGDGRAPHCVRQRRDHVASSRRRPATRALDPFRAGCGARRRDSAAPDRGRRPLRPRREWRTPLRAGRARDRKGVRAR